MKVALLNEKILIQRTVVTSDEIGNRKNVWEDYFSCFATISGEGGDEQLEAGQNLNRVNVSFTVRWCSALSDIDTTGYRIVFHGEIYNILAVDHMNYKKKSLKFKCQKVRR